MAKAKATEKKGLEATMAALTKQFGAGSVVKMGDAPIGEIEVISTGVIGIDIALGRGGLPKGRIIEIYGPESSGKTTLALNAVAEAQKAGGKAAFIDAEHALDPEYAETLGVKVDDLIFAQPDNGEQALEISEKLVSSGELDILVIDSVAALTPQSEIEGEMGDANVGKQARLMSQGLRKITGPASRNGTTVIFINQLREKIGVMFGSPETTTGGKALKFYASVRIDVRSYPIKEGGESTSAKVTVKVVKNKVAPPFKVAELMSHYGLGLDKNSSLIKEALKVGLIEKSGSWLKFNGKSQYEKDLVKELNDNPAMRDELYAKVLELALPKKDAVIIEESAEENFDPETGEILDGKDDPFED